MCQPETPPSNARHELVRPGSRVILLVTDNSEWQKSADSFEAAIVVGVRATPQEPDRARNAKFCLQALHSQDIPRARYKVIVVEQDSEPRLEGLLAPFADRYCFAFNPDLYNRGWGFNVGAWLVPPTGALCLIDGDLVPPPDFVRRALEEFARGKQAFLPYREILYLDPPSTACVLDGKDPQNVTGELFRDSVGGAIWVSAELYRKAGGHDERFQGWGCEDREFYNRLSRIASVERLPYRLYHLHHRHRDPENSKWVQENARLFREIQSGRVEEFSREPGDLRRYIALPDGAAPAKPRNGTRDWQNWHLWPPNRIRSILSEELSYKPQASPRAILAAHVVRLGSSLLDLGCGPGALWPRLRDFRDRLTWIGLDVTQEMLAVAHQEFPDVALCRADVAQLPFDDERFDLVLLRHVLEHLPITAMHAALTEAMRVARNAMVLDFHIPLAHSGARESWRLPEGFLETRWTVGDIVDPTVAHQWRLRERFALRQHAGESNDIWVFEPDRVQPHYSVGPKVSIIMPTYRRPHTLLRTIETVRAQRYSNWELLVIDNSGDGAYLFGDSRIQVHTFTEQASASYARNAAIPHASGELICFFDDDDDMFPDYLEKLVGGFQEHPQAKMVRCGMYVTGDAQNYSYATPECCIRREFATPSWESCGCHDQVYFAAIAERNGWSLENGAIWLIRVPLCRANADGVGGLREGKL